MREALEKLMDFVRSVRDQLTWEDQAVANELCADAEEELED